VRVVGSSLAAQLSRQRGIFRLQRDEAMWRGRGSEFGYRGDHGAMVRFPEIGRLRRVAEVFVRHRGRGHE
jgi:hypothetical protein